ncbi:MAG TPA: DUF4097 family beta strand repeat-containing protein [Vicinamibacteria bacterium]|nr:DUF4097 family beta strand repeat-containing protein [Vicinamibacteria bacterium]
MRTTRLAFLLLLPAALTTAEGRIEQRQSAAPDGIVEIDNPAGSIRVIGWAKNEIQVTGVLGQGASGVDLSVHGRKAVVSVDTMNPHGIKSDLEIRVPAGSRVQIDSFAAEVSVEGVNGEVRAETVNGSIRLSGGFQAAEVSSVNGSIEVSGNTKRLQAESVNGAVTVKGAGGEIAASSVNGLLSVAGSAFDRASLETVSGGLRFEGDLRPEASLDASSVSGATEFVFPATVSADFVITTFSGEIVNELGGPTPTRSSKWTSEKELEFTAGKGGASVTIETLSGTIRLRKRP